MMRRKSSGIALLAILLVGLATLLQMFVDWHQESVSQTWDPVVKAGILAAGGLSLLAVFLTLFGGGRRV